MASRAQILIPVTIAAVIVGVAGIISIPADHKLESAEFPRGSVYLDGMLLDVQVADTAALRTRGLMFQDPLAYDEAMLFIFETSAQHSLWMMNMQFPLDMIWFDSEGRVVHIEEGVPPCKSALETAVCTSLVPPCQALYILEVTAGFVKMHGISSESVLEIVSV